MKRSRIRSLVVQSLLALPVASLFTGCEEPESATEEETFRIGELHIEQRGLDHMTIDMVAGETPTSIDLTRNVGLLAEDATFVLDGKTLTAEEAGIEIPYKGHVEGDPSSWVRMRRVGDSVEGLMFAEGELWELRVSDDGDTWMSKADLEEFLENPTHDNRTCETDASHVVGDVRPSDLAAAPAAPQAAGCKQISIGLVADYTYVAKLGGAKKASNEMLNRINLADGIFRADLGYGFKVGNVQTFGTKGGPSWNTSSSGALPLEQFSQWKRSNLSKLGLAHLFVARTTSGAVGKAWVSATCHAYYGSGVSSYLGTGKASTIVVTHEIGHNFGANHDSSTATFVMAPSVNTRATEFSNKSESQMNAHVGSVSCFTPCS